LFEGDGQLVRAAKRGDRTAFGALVERYQRQAVAVAGRLLGNLDDGLEVAQDGFLRAYEALAQLKEEDRFGPWLMRIMVNRALNFRRQRGRMTPTISLSDSGDDDEPRPGPGSTLSGNEPSAYERLAAGEMAKALQEAIDELPENLRAPLLLFAVEKLPQKEIADMLKCSLQTVKWSVFEARRRLRKRLAKML